MPMLDTKAEPSLSYTHIINWSSTLKPFCLVLLSSLPRNKGYFYKERKKKLHCKNRFPVKNIKFSFNRLLLVVNASPKKLRSLMLGKCRKYKRYWHGNWNLQARFKFQLMPLHLLLRKCSYERHECICVK